MDITGIHPYGLAYRAGCWDPDSGESPGAEFLKGLADSVSDYIATDARAVWGEYGEDRAAELISDMAHEVADAAAYSAGTYYRELWATFADLGAWQEEDGDVADLGGFDPGDDMSKRATLCLYSIGRRLAECLFIEARAEWADRDDGAGAE